MSSVGMGLRPGGSKSDKGGEVDVDMALCKGAGLLNSPLYILIREIGLWAKEPES